MKPIDLYVDGRRFVIEDCDGRAEIRLASQPRAMASSSTTVMLREEFAGARTISVELKVEYRS